LRTLRDIQPNRKHTKKMKPKLKLLCAGYSVSLMLTAATIAAEPASPDGYSGNQTKTSQNSGMGAHELGRTSKASSLMGKEVKNLQGESLGDVTDMIVDLSSGRLVAVIISSGGFLGIGDVLSIVPPSALKYAGDNDESLRLDVSKETLANAPHFKSDEWPDLTKVGYIESVNNAYKLDQAPNAETPYKTDNSKKTARDGEGGEPTAIDQGNSMGDIEITAKIRKEIMARENMSISAQNITIITNGGHVTLRGSVKTADEKRLIAEFATQATSKEPIDNQLEVE